jgi:hypothetical protein
MAQAPDGPPAPPTLIARIKRLLFGKPRDLGDKRIFHHLSVVAFLAWVGLGADGLSSSAYGPEEAFRTLGEHTWLAVPLALLMATTVFIISACYSRIIERFPGSRPADPQPGSSRAVRWDRLCPTIVSIASALTIFGLVAPELRSWSCPRARRMMLIVLARVSHRAAADLPALWSRCDRRRSSRARTQRRRSSPTPTARQTLHRRSDTAASSCCSCEPTA